MTRPRVTDVRLVRASPADLLGRVDSDAAPAECDLCGSTTWWRAWRPGSPWICGVCLPPTVEPHEVEWREAIPIPEAGA